MFARKISGSSSWIRPGFKRKGCSPRRFSGAVPLLLSSWLWHLLKWKRRRKTRFRENQVSVGNVKFELSV